MKDQLITIVVPVYKVPLDMLRKCLDSIIAQTSKNFEALLIDDGSPDNCGKVCDEYASKYDFFHAVHQKNGGLSVVRNNGIQMAKGEWVCFVDGDDWIEPNTIEFAEEYVERCGEGDILIWEEFYDVGDIIKENCFIKGDVSGIKEYSGDKKTELLDMFFPRFYAPFEGNFVDIGTANARLYKKSFLINKGIENTPGLRRMQDNVFNLWAIEKADRIYYQCKRLYHYTFNSEAATQKYAPNNVETMRFLYECIEDFIVRNHSKEPEFYQRLYCRFIRIFGELFKLNYANPHNPKSLRKRLREVREDFEKKPFKEVVECFDTTNQNRKLCFIRNQLKNKHFFLLLLYYSVSIRTRKIRLQMRKK